VLVINAAPRGGAAQEAAEAARETCGVEASPAVIGQRAVFGHALVGAQVAQEVEPAGGPLEIAWHLFTWGDQVEVLKPKRLCTILRAQLTALERAFPVMPASEI
jgi:predicted DNA-binding transcriptional regulator YafY